MVATEWKLIMVYLLAKRSKPDSRSLKGKKKGGQLATKRETAEHHLGGEVWVIDTITVSSSVMLIELAIFTRTTKRKALVQQYRQCLIRNQFASFLFA